MRERERDLRDMDGLIEFTRRHFQGGLFFSQLHVPGLPTTSTTPLRHHDLKETLQAKPTMKQIYIVRYNPPYCLFPEKMQEN